jgi:hypothetical protein
VPRERERTIGDQTGSWLGFGEKARVGDGVRQELQSARMERL